MRPTSSQTTPLSTSIPLPSSQSTAGLEPIPTTTRSASSSVPSDSTTVSTLSVPLHLVHSDAAAHVDALGLVQPGDQRADLLAEHGCKRRRLRFHQNDIHAHPAQARRDLAADEPRADDDGPAGRTGMLAQGDALVERAQHPDALQIRERRNGPRHQSGRDDQLVVGELAAVGQRHRLCGGVHRAHAVAEPHGDVVLLVELRGLERDVVGLGAQHFLGQRRPIVGQMVLVADDRDGTAVLRPAQLFGGSGGGQAASDDHDPRRCAHVGFSTRWPRSNVRHPAVEALIPACGR